MFGLTELELTCIWVFAFLTYEKLTKANILGRDKDNCFRIFALVAGQCLIHIKGLPLQDCVLIFLTFTRLCPDISPGNLSFDLTMGTFNWQSVKCHTFILLHISKVLS